MKKNSVETCESILEELRVSMKYWGRYIDDFVSSYTHLKVNHRLNLSNKSSSQLKFNLMSQVLEHAEREFLEAGREEQRKIANWCFVLIIFENFEFDYRETILRVNSFLQLREFAEATLIDEWSKVEFLAQKNALDYLSTLGWPPEECKI